MPTDAEDPQVRARRNPISDARALAAMQQELTRLWETLVFEAFPKDQQRRSLLNRAEYKLLASAEGFHLMVLVVHLSALGYKDLTANALAMVICEQRERFGDLSRLPKHQSVVRRTLTAARKIGLMRDNGVQRKNHKPVVPAYKLQRMLARYGARVAPFAIDIAMRERSSPPPELGQAFIAKLKTTERRGRRWTV